MKSHVSLRIRDIASSGFLSTRFAASISPLADADQLILDRVTQQSPWALHVSIQDAFAALTAGLGAVWLFLQCLEKISMYGLNHEKVRLEIEKARLDIEERKRQLQSPTVPSITERLGSPLRRKAEAGKDSVNELVSGGNPDEESLLIPPREAATLLKRLRSRGAASLIDRNSRILQNLGYRVLDVEVKTRDAQE